MSLAPQRTSVFITSLIPQQFNLHHRRQHRRERRRHHCLKYGTTTDHVVARESYCPMARGRRFGWRGKMVTICSASSLGRKNIGIVTEATAAFDSNPADAPHVAADFMEVNAASHAVSAIIAPE